MTTLQTLGVDGKGTPRRAELRPRCAVELNSPLARAANIPIPYTGFTGTSTSAPEYRSIRHRGEACPRRSQYRRWAILERDFSRGLQARGGYTYSHLMTWPETGRGAKDATTAARNPPIHCPGFLERRNAACTADRVHGKCTAESGAMRH